MIGRVYISFTTITLVAFLLLTPFLAIAESIGPKSPPSNSIVNDASTGTWAWTNPGRAAGNDELFAAVSAAGDSQYLKATNFGFDIPTGSTIDGIKVEIARNTSIGIVKDNEVKLVKDGVIQSTNKANTVTAWPGSEAYASYGGENDAWGATWEASDVNSSNFGVVLSINLVDNEGDGAFGRVDHIRVTVYYTPDSQAPAISTLSPADNATGVATNTNLVMTFDEAVDAESGNITIKKTSDDSTVEEIDITSGQVTGSGTDEITVNLSNELDYETSYYIQIDDTAFDDESGNSYAGINDTTSWNFTTEAIPVTNTNDSEPSDNSNKSSGGGSDPVMSTDNTVSLEGLRPNHKTPTITVTAGKRLRFSTKPIDADRIKELYLRINGKKYHFVNTNNDLTYIVIIPSLPAGTYNFALTADWGITTRTQYGKVIVSKDKTVAPDQINRYFELVYGRVPSVSEWTYWANRRSEKPFLPAFIGALQYHHLHNILH